MIRSVLKGLWFTAIICFASIAMAPPCLAHGGGGGAVGGGGIGGGPGSGAGGGMGAGGGIGGIGVSAGPVGASPGAGGIGGGPGGAGGAIGGVVGPAPAVGGIGGGVVSGAAGSAVTGAVTGATPGVGSIGGGAVAGVPSIGTAGPAGESVSQREPSALHEALYGPLGVAEPSFGDVMKAGIRANSATEGAVSTLPTLPAVAPAVEATAPVAAPITSQYAAAAEAPASSRAGGSPRVRHHAHRSMRRRSRISRPAVSTPLQMSIVPAAPE